MLDRCKLQATAHCKLEVKETDLELAPFLTVGFCPPRTALSAKCDDSLPRLLLNCCCCCCCSLWLALVSSVMSDGDAAADALADVAGRHASP
jgi:hypothetical protein